MHPSPGPSSRTRSYLNPMKVVIIEDEKLAAEKLDRYLKQYDASMEVVAQLPSISEAVTFLTSHQQELDVIFMDIQLTDGLSFEIFHQINIQRPVIFTTAYDEYAIDAFKVNSIDYLLKPISFMDLTQALKKFEGLKKQFAPAEQISTAIQQIAEKSHFKDRFLVKRGNHIQSIPVSEIILFYAEGRTAFLLTQAGKKYIIEYKLEDLEGMLNPRTFFRVNRSYIVSIRGIQDILMYSNSRLKITLVAETDKEIIVSREKVKRFKSWLEGE